LSESELEPVWLDVLKLQVALAKLNEFVVAAELEALDGCLAVGIFETLAGSVVKLGLVVQCEEYDCSLQINSILSILSFSFWISVLLSESLLELFFDPPELITFFFTTIGFATQYSFAIALISFSHGIESLLPFELIVLFNIPPLLSLLLSTLLFTSIWPELEHFMSTTKWLSSSLVVASACWSLSICSVMLPVELVEIVWLSVDVVLLLRRFIFGAFVVAEFCDELNFEEVS
jgi:hypothetical protein